MANIPRSPFSGTSLPDTGLFILARAGPEYEYKQNAKKTSTGGLYHP